MKLRDFTDSLGLTFKKDFDRYICATKHYTKNGKETGTKVSYICFTKGAVTMPDNIMSTDILCLSESATKKCNSGKLKPGDLEISEGTDSKGNPIWGVKCPANRTSANDAEY